jgi:hypothetical protein
VAATTDTAVIGAGPYGLSVSAHLRARGADLRTFGQPLHTWRTAMPKGMMLKSDGFASNLSAPGPGSLLADYCAEHELPYHPTDLSVPLQTFVDYGLDFQRRHVPDLEQTDVRSVERDGRLLRITPATGEELTARKVVVATGITHFAAVPRELAHLSPDLVSHSSAHHVLDRFRGQRVTVLGAGASAVVVAVSLAAAGARTSLVARSPRVRFSSPPGPRSWAEKLRSPGSGLGPGWKSRASCDAPDLFRVLPAPWRPEIVRRHLGPSSAWHLQSDFEAHVEVHTGRTLDRADAVEDGVRLVLGCRHGDREASPLVVEADHVICATGYHADVQRLGFLSPSIRSDLRTLGSSPVLSRSFESSVRDLYFLGLPAAVSFGPLMRFMYGDRFAARRIVRSLTRDAR